ncbi:3-hydroxyacyl-CoA dehydrogenase NAD-binding domain-containing protein [Cryobacterium sp. CG_9.6]|uniref:3-hydroxyacyl-CoA dehydrogenase NAD-binding domain-containing protein n=1 Tax=Cryobacterium sp. CG_9.6 TaxID=2760710 RepID=UPI0024746D52|nr:3-hydroxyacyl-CoA dehydrogenase NAD-binding domain-containing protein [Cryobacterium sp. CG_9.6]MDH6235477.1 3-hydroxyacyl-CoA dehydrogenase/enoyl-CoA hydratase/carnithine racemase [Cryobacterium sp. CG_9.6]
MVSAAHTRIKVGLHVSAGHTIAVVNFVPAPGALVTWTPDALRALTTAVRKIGSTHVDAVAFVGTGSAFGAGADLGGFQSAQSAADGEQLARDGYLAFATISRLSVPTFAFINGAAVGGALELALRCDYRTVAASARNIGLPEVRLGLLPGWGGLTSLCELVGVTGAADVAITRSLAGRYASAQEAERLGLADMVLPSDDFLAASLSWAAAVLNGSRLPIATGPAPVPWNPAAVRAAVAKRIPGVLPAVESALTLLSAWNDRYSAPVAGNRTAARLARAGDALEADTIAAFGTLLHSDECRASIYAFFAVQAARKRSRPTPARSTDLPGVTPVTHVGVVGGGLMATQLAYLFADRLDVPTHLIDLSAERVDLALERVSSQLDRSVKRGMTTTERDRIASLVTAGTDATVHAPCEMVIEAVFEDLTVKRAVWASVEDVVADTTVLLTNTSSLSIANQGEGLRHPERLIGFHFFNPVAVLPLVEIVRSVHTSQAAVDAAFALAGSLGKTAVLVKDSPGFVVNRLLTRLFSDTLELIDAGTDARAVDSALVSDGLPMTALTLLEYIGPAVQLHILETMNAGANERFRVSPSLCRIVTNNLTGYLGDDGYPSPEVTAILDQVYAVSKRMLPTTPTDIRAFLLTGLADEAWRMLAEGTVESADDIDACMILGANYPQHTGGLTPLLDRSGASVAANGVRFHALGVANAPVSV